MQRHALNDINLTWQQFELLRYTCEHNVATLHSAADRFGLEAAEVMNAAAHLDRRGLLYLSSDRDTRAAIVAATERGYDVVAAVQLAIAAEENWLLYPFRPEDVSLILAVFSRAAARTAMSRLRQGQVATVRGEPVALLRITRNIGQRHGPAGRAE